MDKFFLIKQFAARDYITKNFGDGLTCGPRELATSIQKVNEIKPFLRLSEEGLINLIDLAFKISLKREESRYPNFQIYSPSDGFLPANNNGEIEWLVCFDPPIALVNLSEQPIKVNIDTLYRISSGIPSRPYAICIEEAEGILKAHGVIRIENSSILQGSNTGSSTTNIYPGLLLNVEGPGILRVFISNTSWKIFENLALRHGRIEVEYDPFIHLQEIFDDIETEIRATTQKDLSSNLGKYIGQVWSFILNLAVEFGHGGQFIILPSEQSVNKDEAQKYGSLSIDEDGFLRIREKAILKVKHNTSNSKPHLRLNLISFDQASNLISKYQPPVLLNPAIGNPLAKKKLSEETFENAFNRGVHKGVSQSKLIQDHYQNLFDSAKAIAKLSTVDGCLIFDRGLKLLGFKGEVLIREEKKEIECITLDENLQVKLDEVSQRPKKFDIRQYGTRHGSAARFCGKVTGAIVFVVSQDGDIRVFKNLGDRKVGVAGPFRSLPGLSLHTGNN